VDRLRQERKHNVSRFRLRGGQGEAAVAQTVSHHNDVVLAHLTTLVFDFVPQPAGFENDNFEVIGTMKGNDVAVSTIQNQEAHIHRIAVTERPDMQAVATDLPIDKTVGLLPRPVAGCSHRPPTKGTGLYARSSHTIKQEPHLTKRVFRS